ncbi:hypothetical protein NKH77_10905 [Streptomyces sp. M19]
MLPGDAAAGLTRSWVYTAFGRGERHLSVVHGWTPRCRGRWRRFRSPSGPPGCAPAAARERADLTNEEARRAPGSRGLDGPEHGPGAGRDQRSEAAPGVSTRSGVGRRGAASGLSSPGRGPPGRPRRPVPRRRRS